jgi:DNA-binding IscR family transcriptional regulator
MTDDGVSTYTVIRTVHNLHDQRGKWPTVEAVAERLGISADSARELLLELRRARIFRDRRRRGERVWMPWDERGAGA